MHKAPAALLLTALGLTACSSSVSSPAPTPTPAALKADDAAVNEARYQCLQDKGFAVTRDDHGAIVFIDPEDKQYAKYVAADKQCTDKLVQLGLVQATTQQDMRAEYKVATQLHDCLAKAGLPVVPWMSWEQFQDKQGQYNVLLGTQPITTDDARKACPREMSVMEQP